MPHFEMEISLPVNPEQLSSELLLMSGVNYELSPYLSMSAPLEWVNKPISDWPVDCEIFTSTIFLFGLIPIDRHHFKFVSVDGMGFKESSRSLFNSEWSHERTISLSGAGAKVKDVVHYTSKIGFVGYLFKPFYQAVFSYRHKRLKRKYA